MTRALGMGMAGLSIISMISFVYYACSFMRDIYRNGQSVLIDENGNSCCLS